MVLGFMRAFYVKPRSTSIVSCDDVLPLGEGGDGD